MGENDETKFNFKNIQEPLLKMNAGKNQSKRRGGCYILLKKLTSFIRYSY